MASSETDINLSIRDQPQSTESVAADSQIESAFPTCDGWFIMDVVPGIGQVTATLRICLGFMATFTKILTMVIFPIIDCFFSVCCGEEDDETEAEAVGLDDCAIVLLCGFIGLVPIVGGVVIYTVFGDRLQSIKVLNWFCDNDDANSD
jgi:hypothetical protein